MTKRDYLILADHSYVTDTKGRLISFTEAGAHRWADKHLPQSYSVIPRRNVVVE